MKLAITIAAAFALPTSASAAADPEFRTASTYLDAEVDGKLELERWEVTDEQTPYEATVSVAPGQSRQVCLISGTGPRCNTLKPGSPDSRSVPPPNAMHSWMG